MKILNLFIALFAVSITTFAQSPNSINYQAVLRDDGSALISDQNVGVQITILSGSISGTPVYQETHATSTNANGLMSIAIGTGSSADDFSSIDWSNGPYFIKTEADPSGGSNYTVTGTSQMMSVPYALYAKTSGSSITTAQAQAIEDNTLDIVDAFTKISANETDIATNAGDISDLIDGQGSQNNVIALNTAKVGITSEQASAILANGENVTNVETDLNELILEIGSLPDGYIFIGNANGVTEAVQVQGDATIGSNGVSITADAVNTAKILNETILNEDIAANAAIDQSKINGLKAVLDLKANLADPTFTGTVTADTLDLAGAINILSDLQDNTYTEIKGTLNVLAENASGENIALRIFGNDSSDYYSGGKIVFGDYDPGSFGVSIFEDGDENLKLESLGGDITLQTNNSNINLNGSDIYAEKDIYANAFIGDGSGLTNITSTATVEDESITSAKIMNATIVNADISDFAAIAQSKIDGLTTALAGKQNTIADGGLTFSTTSNVTSNSGGALATDDFVFGSSQLKNDNTTTDDDSRMYYDKSKGAFRAGEVDSDQWDELGVGDYSVAIGFNSEANGLYSVGMGFNAAASGESAIAIGRFSIASGTGSFAVGADATSNPGIGPKASNRGSIAMGVNTISSGEAAVATGFGSSASGFSSFAIGEETVASGDNSVAGGYGSQATRSESVAIGMQANANADKSVAIGNNVTANTFNEVVFGRYNTTASLNKTNWSASNPLFTVGNGSGTNNTNNAFQILKNGDASLDGTLTANAFVGNGSGLTGVTASVSLAEGDVTTTEILNSTILNEDISATAAIAQSKISGLSSSFDAKQDLISDGDLSIANTSGLQAVLDTKAPLESPLFNNATLTGVVSLNSAAIQLVGETDTDGKILISDSNGFLLLESPSFASGNSSGIVSDDTQSFGGNKTFVSAVNVEGTFNAKSNAFVDGDLKADRYVMTAAGAASGAAITLNLSTANLFTINIDQDITNITLTNAAVGTYIIKFQRDTVGNRAIALPSEWKWSGGSIPTITQVGSALDIVTLIYDGTNYYAAISQNF